MFCSFASMQICSISVVNHDATKRSWARLYDHRFPWLHWRRSKFYWKIFKTVVIFGFCAFFSQYPLLISLRSYFQLLDKLWHLSSDLYRHTLKTVNTRFKFFAISISWAKTNLFSLWILHLFTPSSLIAPNGEGLLALKHFFDLRTVKEPSSETLLLLAELVLTLNCFSFADIYYKQINGVAMGTKMGPSYANLFVGYIEHKFFNQYSGPKPEPSIVATLTR